MKKLLFALLIPLYLNPMNVHQGVEHSPQSESGKNCVHVTINNQRRYVNEDKEKPSCAANCLPTLMRTAQTVASTILRFIH